MKILKEIIDHEDLDDGYRSWRFWWRLQIIQTMMSVIHEDFDEIIDHEDLDEECKSWRFWWWVQIIKILKMSTDREDFQDE
jgi:predicted component of viral defense system (DUF524 family)